LPYYRYLQLNGQHLSQKFGIWGSLGVLPPKGEKQRPGHYMNHHAKLHTDQWHCRRDICPWTKKTESTKQI